jgi:hypothetical protein
MELVIGKSGEFDFSINAQELVTGRTCIIAQSGAGKSWSIAVLCERLCRENIGFCLIDTEGEYFSLKDKFPVLWIGTDEQCDHDIETVNLRDVMTQAVKCGTAVIFDVSETDMQERVSKLANVIYDIESELRIPYLLIVEEADKFIPQSKESLKKIEEISRRGRKRGLGLLVATQRPALVTKHVLSQCNNQIIGKLSIENDLRAVDLFFGSRKELEELASLNPGEFFVMGRLVREKTKMRFGNRETKHRGLTPQLSQRPKVKQEIKPRPPAEEPCGEPVLLEAAETTGLEEPVESLPGNAVAPFITREQALEIAQGKRKKKRLIMGVDERITEVRRVYWPLYVLEVRYIGGRLKKSTKSASFLLDGTGGFCADIGWGLKLRPCFGELAGLEEESIRILAHLTKDGATEADLEAATKLPAAAVRRGLKDLTDRKLVTVAGKIGNASIYVPLLLHRVPRLAALNGKVEAHLVPLKGGSREPEIERDDIRRILKGLEPTAEITRSDIVYYPVYEIAFASDRNSRTLCIDAVTGRTIERKA